MSAFVDAFDDLSFEGVAEPIRGAQFVRIICEWFDYEGERLVSGLPESSNWKGPVTAYEIPANRVSP